LANKNIEYFPIDISPEKYKFIKCLKEDAANMSFYDNTFDIIISNHIMEHVEDDNLFLKEMLRVLKPKGKFFLTFPIRWGLEKTFEDKSIVSPQERLKVFGQSDHVRRYGRDIVERLKTEYKAQAISVSELFNKEQIKLYRNRSGVGAYVFIITKNN
jgi:ubiquinone/menaquinone biosynthesis C-methylase UbiE